MTEPITAPAPNADAPPAAPPAALAPRPAKEVRVVVSDTQILDTGMFEQMQRIALSMSEASILPDHLVAHPWWDPKNKMSPAERMQTRDKLGADEFRAGMAEAKKRTIANCFLVVEQSVRWGMSPFAVAPETYVVGGKLAFQGKLVLAVVNELAGLEKRLDFEWSGEGKTRQITIRGRFKGDPVERVDTIVWDKVKTDNKMWAADPDQKLLYTGVLHWARRWCPEVVLGVKTIEDLERIVEDEARALPRIPSTLDAFAGGAQASAALSSAPIDVSALPDDMRAADSGIPEPRGEEAGPVVDVTAAAAAAESSGQQEAGGGPRPKLTEENIAKLRALMKNSPPVQEEAVVAKLGAPLADFEGEPGEAQNGLYTRALTAIRDLKGKKE